MKSIIGFVAILAVLMAGAALTGVTSVANAESVSFSVQAAGANEVPAVTSGGAASGEFTFDSETNELSYIIAVRGVDQADVTAAHIHRGAAGVNGDVAYTLADEGFLQIAGSVELTDEDVDALFAGELYLNVHSVDYPDGFARGQLNPPELTEDDDAEVTATPDSSPTVTPGEGTDIMPPNTGDGGLSPGGGTNPWLPAALVVALLAAGSGLVLFRSRA